MAFLMQPKGSHWGRLGLRLFDEYRRLVSHLQHNRVVLKLRETYSCRSSANRPNVSCHRTKPERLERRNGRDFGVKATLEQNKWCAVSRPKAFPTNRQINAGLRTFCEGQRNDMDLLSYPYNGLLHFHLN